MESPAAARRHAVRVDALKDEPLLAALPQSHRYASEPTIPICEFVAGPVLLPREPAGLTFNAWFRSVMRVHGYELEQTTAIASAPWDRRLPPVANGEGVAVMVADWTEEPGSGLVAVPVRAAAELSDGPRFVRAIKEQYGHSAAPCPSERSGSGTRT